MFDSKRFYQREIFPQIAVAVLHAVDTDGRSPASDHRPAYNVQNRPGRRFLDAKYKQRSARETVIARRQVNIIKIFMTSAR